MTIQLTPIQRTLEHQAKGRFAEAETICREFLQLNPDHPAALNLLGVACSQQGRKDEGAKFLERAIAIQPNAADLHSNLAMIYVESGKLDEAIATAHRAIALQPAHIEAINILASVLCQLGRCPEALDWLKRSLSVRPQQPEMLAGMIEVCRRMGRHDYADAVSQRLLAIQPNNHDGLAFRGETLLNQRRYAEAAAVFQSLIDAHPQSWVGYNGLGVALFHQGRISETAPLYQKAIELVKGRNPGPHNNAGFVCIGEGQLEEAIEHFQKALEIRADSPNVYVNLANAYAGRLELDRAITAYDRALFFQPDNPDAHLGKALLLMLQGKFSGGLLEYEWRWLKFFEHRQSFEQPAWDGYDIAGKTILLHSEQGFGDTIQFARFARIIAARGANVILRCDRELVSLLSRMDGGTRVVPRESPAPPFDVHCSLLSVLYALKITADTIPGNAPYLFADESLKDRWRKLIDGLEGMKIGICWAGDSSHTRNRDRSASLEMFALMRDLPGVHWVSLQKGQPGREPVPRGFNLVNMTDRLHDFADTAALIANLDLVISVDTAVAHLAGGLGKPVWTLVPFKPDWRWMLDREDSPWYPTMRLFRQRTRRDWSEVIGRVRVALEQILSR